VKRIHLNGQTHETRAEDVAALVAELGFPRGTALVELDGIALRPEEWKQPLAEGARVEILRIVAGG
jgi:thiamine biosynthesis protein ThiS